MLADALDCRGRGENGRKRGPGDADWVHCPEETRLNTLKKLSREVAIPVQLRHLSIQDIQWRNRVGPARAASLCSEEVPAVCQLAEVELHGPLTKLNLRRQEARQHHRRLARSRPKEAQGAQCTKTDHAIEGMKACPELNGTTLDGGCIEKEGEDGRLDHVLHYQGVKAPKGTGATLNQS